MLLKIACAVAAAVVMGGCASVPSATPAGADKPASATEVVGTSALPPGAVFKSEQSLIIGAGDQWVGRVVADVGRDTDGAFRFFLDTYPAQGWTLISSVRGRISLLVFTKQDRTATVELAEGGVLGSAQVTLTVSPRNAAVLAPRKP